MLDFAHRGMRVAIVHYWLLGMRGGEKVVEALCRLAPEADIFTLFYDPEKVSPLIRSHRVTASFLNPLRSYYRSLLPLMPLALEHFDLRGYDLVISSESGPAKGVLTDSNARHVCYCHTPMRYLWDLYPAYLHEFTRSRMKRTLMAPLASYLRLWDLATAARVDDFVSNSENVRRRIWKTYRRVAEVVHPPVPVETFRCEPSEDYYLIVSELVPYKRIDIAVKVFQQSGRKLCVVGEGPEFARLRNGAPANIEFCGRVSDEQLRGLYARCRAFLMPGEEDFGITAVEAVASGKAVIALGRGGVLEIVPAEGAFFYDSPDEASLSGAVRRFEDAESSVSPQTLQAAAARFSEMAFDEKMGRILCFGNV
jgi:glycosyltransferase involved in cell wall biosynthesis